MDIITCKESRKYAYVTVLTSDNYALGVELLKASLDRVNTIYPLVCLYTEDVSGHVTHDFEIMGINCVKINKIDTPENIFLHNIKINERQANVWKHVLTKMQVWDFTDYDKVILMDCDICVLKNLDHCFDYENMTAALDGEYFNLWPAWPHFNSGFLVIEPNHDEYESIINFAMSLDPEQYKNYKNEPYILADQEILNLYYNDWKDKPELHLSKYYNIFAPHASAMSEEDILNNAFFIHYVGCKPWMVDENGSYIMVKHQLGKDAPVTLYAIANAVLNLFHKGLVENLNIDWKKTTKNGIFDFMISENLCNLYKNYDKSEEYLRLAIMKDPENELFAKTLQEIQRIKRTFLHQDLLKPVLNKMYQEIHASGEPSLWPYMCLEILNSGAEINGLTITETLWEEFKNIIIKLAKENL